MTNAKSNHNAKPNLMIELNQQESFLADLKSFLTNHSYFKANQGTLNHDHKNDVIETEINDPNGDYERIVIITNLVA